MSSFLQDLRVSLRTLLKDPGFTVVAVLTLALGIGTNGAIFSIVHAILLRPYPYPEPEELAIVLMASPDRGVRDVRLSYPEFIDFRKQSQTFEDMAAVQISSFALTGGDEPVRVRGARATSSLFHVIGGRMTLGRGFLPQEDAPGFHVLVLSENLWRRQFGADPGIIGRALQVDGKPHTVVGVISTAAQFPDVKDAELLIPVGVHPADEPRGSRSYLVIARLAEGVALEQAQSEMQTLGAQLAQAYLDSNANWTPRVLGLREFRSGDERPALLLALFAVFLVLLIACSNVANLLLQRGLVRSREMAIRNALGGTRGRLLQQLLGEGVALALLGGAVGLLLAWWMVQLFRRVLPAEEVPGYVRFDIDLAVVLYLLGVSLLSVLFFSLIPSLRSTRIDLRATLTEAETRAAGGGVQRQRLRSALVVSEIALSLVLLASAMLLIQSFRKLQEVDPGFDPKNTLVVPLSLPEASYPDDAARTALYSQVLARVKALPGVKAAGSTSTVPILDWGGSPIMVEGQTLEEAEHNPITGFHGVDGDLFQALGIPLLAGRAFTERDAEGSQAVVVVNRTLAEHFWPGQDPLGKRIRFDPEDEEWIEVVGVVGDVKSWGLGRSAPLDVYRPYRQVGGEEQILFMRTAFADPLAVLPAVRRAVAEIDPGLPVDGVGRMDEMLASSLWRQRLFSTVFSVFAAFALFLASVGIYGTMAYSVSQRRHEIGIRMALGAHSGEVQKMVIKQVLRLVSVGIVIGVVGAFGMAKLMDNLLYGVSDTAIVTLFWVALIMVTISIFATLVPARRAARVLPAVVLRS